MFLRRMGSVALCIHARLAGLRRLLRLLRLGRLRCLCCAVGCRATCEFGHGRILLHVIDGDTGAERQIFTAGWIRNQAEWCHAFRTGCRNARTRLHLGGHRVVFALWPPSGAPVSGFAGVKGSCRARIQRGIWVIISRLRLRLRLRLWLWLWLWRHGLLRLLGALCLRWFCVLRRLLCRCGSLLILLRLSLSRLDLWFLLFSRFRGASSTGLGSGQGLAHSGGTLTRGARIRGSIR